MLTGLISILFAPTATDVTLFFRALNFKLRGVVGMCFHITAHVEPTELAPLLASIMAFKVEKNTFRPLAPGHTTLYTI